MTVQSEYCTWFCAANRYIVWQGKTDIHIKASWKLNRYFGPDHIKHFRQRPQMSFQLYSVSPASKCIFLSDSHFRLRQGNWLASPRTWTEPQLSICVCRAVASRFPVWWQCVFRLSSCLRGLFIVPAKDENCEWTPVWPCCVQLLASWRGILWGCENECCWSTIKDKIQSCNPKYIKW